MKVPLSDIQTAEADRIKDAEHHVQHFINAIDSIGMGLSLVKNMETKREAKLKVIDQTNFSSDIEFQPGSMDSPTASSLTNTNFGITCKERSSKPRMEKRGTKYWALYNYIPADEVTYF